MSNYLLINVKLAEKSINTIQCKHWIKSCINHSVWTFAKSQSKIFKFTNFGNFKQTNNQTQEFVHLCKQLKTEDLVTCLSFCRFKICSTRLLAPVWGNHHYIMSWYYSILESFAHNLAGTGQQTLQLQQFSVGLQFYFSFKHPSGCL